MKCSLQSTIFPTDRYSAGLVNPSSGMQRRAFLSTTFCCSLRGQRSQIQSTGQAFIFHSIPFLRAELQNPSGRVALQRGLEGLRYVKYAACILREAAYKASFGERAQRLGIYPRLYSLRKSRNPPPGIPRIHPAELLC